MKVEKKVHPYGLWPSPVKASMLATHTRIEDVHWEPDGSGLVWLESRGGTTQLVSMLLGEARQDLLSEHTPHGGVGFGGGEFGLGRNDVFFAEKNGALYRRSYSPGLPAAITPAYGGLASPVVSPSGRWVMYVHSDGVEDVIALVDSDGSNWPVKLVQGADFYMQPVWSPAENAIAWIEWDHPNMPWDSTRLMLASLTGDPPRIDSPRLIAGEHGEMVVQPRFSPDGQFLSYIVNRGEWEALEVLELASGQSKTWLEGDTHLSTPAWTQGQHSYDWSPFGKTIFILRNKAGKAELCSITQTGEFQVIPTEPYTWIEQISVSPVNDDIAMIASSPTMVEQVIRWGGHRWRVVAYSETPTLLPGDLPDPQPVEWDTSDGQKAYGLFSPPNNSRFKGKGAPPLIVHVHGGPTSQSVVAFPRDAHYFTSRGYAWLEVNYRGSSGYGKSYRDALRGNWGKFDVEDAVSGAKSMASRRLVDGKKMAIFGGSAGGFTVLNALAQYPGVFKAGIALYPVADLFTLALETHKFEQHYDESLLGKVAAAVGIYRQRSPLYQAEKIKDPLAIFHGSSDKAVPVGQSQAIIRRLETSEVPHLFQIYEGEGHGFRSPETLLDMYPKIEQFLIENVLFPPDYSK